MAEMKTLLKAISDATLKALAAVLFLGLGSFSFASEPQNIYLKGKQYSACGSIHQKKAFYVGGIEPNGTLTVGHPTNEVRADRTLLVFDLEEMEESLKEAKKIEVVFHITWMNGTDGSRLMEISLAHTPPNSLSSEDLSSEGVEVLGSVKIPRAAFNTRAYTLEITKPLQAYLAQGKKRAMLRFRDVTAEEAGNEEREPAGMVIGSVERTAPYLSFLK